MSDPNHDDLTGSVVEVHLNGGKRFLGRIRRQTPRTAFCCSACRCGCWIRSLPESDMREELRRIVSSVFVPYVGIEYIDVGGEPIGFNELYGTSFGGESLESFFTHPLDKSRRHEG